MKMKHISNEPKKEPLEEAFENLEEGSKSPDKAELKEFKKMISELTLKGEKLGIPIMVISYEPENGYQYKAVLPEMFDDPVSRSQYGKFTAFLQICAKYNEGMPVIQVDKHTEEE